MSCLRAFLGIASVLLWLNLFPVFSFVQCGNTKPRIIETFCFPVGYCVDRHQMGVGTPTVLCGGFFSGLLEALLGKPGTLHSPGQIITSALGVPPDLRGAPVWEVAWGPRQGGGCWLHPRRSRGSSLPLLPGRDVPPAQVWWGASSNSFTPRPSACFLTSPARHS